MRPRLTGLSQNSCFSDDIVWETQSHGPQISTKTEIFSSHNLKQITGKKIRLAKVLSSVICLRRKNIIVKSDNFDAI